MQHKWHKEIKAWADGKTIQARWNDKMSNVKHDWHDCDGLIDWDLPASDFRIKPQPEEPQYLYVLKNNLEVIRLVDYKPHPLKEYVSTTWKCIGKIKLEVDDVPSDV